ncbi:MAG: peptidoglycan binding protein CsiV [Thiotrichales bacterium]|nr:peptidoglycan binding protein CsiV [Thiotrichales bacterium]
MNYLPTAPLSRRAKLSRWFAASLLAITSMLLGNLAYAEARYQVEVIVFEHLGTKGWGEENWRPNLSPISTQNTTADNQFNRAPLFLRPESLQMSDLARKMQTGYRVIYHQSWSQNAPNRANGPKVLVDHYQGNSYLSGTIGLYKTRFAHLDMNLTLARTLPNSVRADFAARQGIPESQLPDQWRFQLKEKRKMANGELHYFDHPLFGALVRIQAR